LEKANAKINLHLSILNRRKDNYHNIFSLICPLEFSDKISIIDLETRKNGSCNIQSEGVYKSIIENLDISDNLINKAYFKYFSKTGLKPNVTFKIEKNIPSGAGLGGGSSNAAAVLRLLNKSFGFYSKKQLFKIGSEIGADVPVCLYNNIAIVEGLGNKIKEIRINKFDWIVLLVLTEVHVSTKNAYQMLGYDDMSNLVYTSREIKKQLKLKKFILFQNDFEQIVFKMYPELQNIKNELNSSSAEYVSMSGSGSAIFALFKTNEQVNEVYSNSKLKQYTKIITKVKF
jgi:4-diphosphocytidyl-2-C-methyl-D-erythritol kinase